MIIDIIDPLWHRTNSQLWVEARSIWPGSHWIKSKRSKQFEKKTNNQQKNISTLFQSLLFTFNLQFIDFSDELQSETWVVGPWGSSTVPELELTILDELLVPVSSGIGIFGIQRIFIFSIPWIVYTSLRGAPLLGVTTASMWNLKNRMVSFIQFDLVFSILFYGIASFNISESPYRSKELPCRGILGFGAKPSFCQGSLLSSPDESGQGHNVSISIQPCLHLQDLTCHSDGPDLYKHVKNRILYLIQKSSPLLCWLFARVRCSSQTIQLLTPVSTPSQSSERWRRWLSGICLFVCWTVQSRTVAALRRQRSPRRNCPERFVRLRSSMIVLDHL